MRGVRISVLYLACVFMTVGISATEFEDNGTIASEIETKLQDYLMNREMEGFKYGVYQQGPTYEQGKAYVSNNPKREFFDRHIAAHCSATSEAESKGFGCQGAQGAAPEDVKYFEFGDVKFSVLLEPDVYTEGTNLLAQGLIKNLTTPFPDAALSAFITSGDFSDSNMRDQYAEYMAAQASIGVALYSFNEMYGMRVPGKDLGITDPADVADGSIMSAMESELTRRFLGKEFGGQSNYQQWLLDASTKELDVLKDMARMQATSLWMEYLRYRQSERIESLIAAGMTSAVNADIQRRDQVRRASRR